MTIQTLQMETKNKNNPLFPIFLKLENLRVLVVGGGPVALEKINSILSNSPETEVNLIAPEILEEINQIARTSPNVKLKQRAFFPGDLYNADLVIAATSDRELNKAIQQES